MNLTHTNSNLRFVGEANFDSQVLQSKSGVLVAFRAPWSKPCHVTDPVPLEVAQTCAGKIEVVKVNADDNPTLGLWFGVQHIPTLLYFEAGSFRAHLVRTASNDAIRILLFRRHRSRAGNVSPSEEELYEQTIQQRRTTVNGTTHLSSLSSPQIFGSVPSA